MNLRFWRKTVTVKSDHTFNLGDLVTDTEASRSGGPCPDPVRR